jgi:glycerophosphoryl diester phosphodiesterase
MRISFLRIGAALLLAFAGLSPRFAAANENPVVIAHRGASAVLPEHTLAAKAAAHVMGADFIEQDVVLTRDGVPVVLHDLYLDAVTDVARVFPGRNRKDGRFYAMDFSRAELRRLSVHERVSPWTRRPVYPGRFPADAALFRLNTLDEEIALIRGLNASTGRTAGIYVEIKDPAAHRKAGLDISRIVLETLHRHGYRERTDPAIVQSFDPSALRRLRSELDCRLRLVQLIGENRWGMNEADYDTMRTPAGLREVATYADGIGPRVAHVLTGVDGDGKPAFSPLVSDARRAGLAVHVYTLRHDALPPGISDFPTLLGFLFREAGVDGAFTDAPDRVLRFLGR